MDDQSPRAHYGIEAKRFRIDLWRLSDRENDDLKERSFPIEVDRMIMMRLALEERGKLDRLILPKLFVTLEAIFGPSSTDLYERKQCFKFPCFLRIQRNGQTLPYLLEIEDYQGDPSFRLYRVIDHEKFFDLDLRRSHPPIADELNAENVEYFICVVWIHLTISGNAICEEKITARTLKPFFHNVNSSNFIYGYIDDNFFEREIDDSDKYHSAVAELTAKYRPKELPAFQRLVETESMIEAIIL
jgi:hypothetical protein